MANGDADAVLRRQILIIGTTALSGAVIMFLLWYFLLRTPFMPAFTGINSNDALTITQELNRLKTPYDLADDGTTILVPQTKVDEVRVNILGSELPLKGAVGFELFNKTDMGITEFAQKINYQRALQGELARTIMALDQIETARVHLSLPEEGIFEQDRRPAKASITIATKIGGEIEGNVVRGIQQLVASAVPDLQVSDVAILDSRGQLLSLVAAGSERLADTPEQQRRQAYEQIFASKVEDAIRASGIAIPLKVKVTALQTFGGSSKVSVGEEALTDRGKPLPDVNKKRDHALDVQLQLAALPGELVQAKLLAAARDAVAYDQSVGDAVAIQINPLVADWPSDPVIKPARRRTSEPPKKISNLDAIPVLPILGGLFLLIILVFAIGFLRKSKAPLDVKEKTAFADRLKSLLENEVRNGHKPA
jgi:flagellar M-ring protein FliF